MKQATRTRVESNIFKESFKPKTIKVFVNGENKCYLCEINPRILKCWSDVLIHVSYNVHAKFGDVAKLLALSTLQQVTTFTQLDSREKYIALGDNGKFKRSSNGYKTPSEENVRQPRRQLNDNDLRQSRVSREATPTSVQNVIQKRVYSVDEPLRRSRPASTTEKTNLNQKTLMNRRTSSKTPIPAVSTKDESPEQIAQNKFNNQKRYEQNQETASNKGRKWYGRKKNSNTASENFQDAIDHVEKTSENQMYQNSSNVRSPDRVSTCSSPIFKSRNYQDSIVDIIPHEEPHIKCVNKTGSKNVGDDMKTSSRKISKGNKIERELERLMDLEKNKYMISMYALKHVKKVLHEIRHNCIKSNVPVKSNKNKNIFHPSPTTSIQNLAAKSFSSNNQEKILHVSEITSELKPTLPKKRERIVIPHATMTKRMHELSTTILAYRRKISEMNEQICDECDKCQNKDCTKNQINEQGITESCGCSKPQPSDVLTIVSASVETLI